MRASSQVTPYSRSFRRHRRHRRRCLRTVGSGWMHARPRAMPLGAGPWPCSSEGWAWGEGTSPSSALHDRLSSALNFGQFSPSSPRIPHCRLERTPVLSTVRACVSESLIVCNFPSSAQHFQEQRREQRQGHVRHRHPGARGCAGSAHHPRSVRKNSRAHAYSLLLFRLCKRFCSCRLNRCGSGLQPRRLLASYDT